MKTTYTSDFKIKFLQRVAQGEKAATLARELGVPKTTAYEWIKSLNTHGWGYFQDSNLTTQPQESPQLEDAVVFKLLNELKDIELHPDAISAYELKRDNLKQQYPAYAEYIDKLAQHFLGLAINCIEEQTKSGTLRFLHTVHQEIESNKSKMRK